MTQPKLSEMITASQGKTKELAPHLMIEARAGTGKTFTAVEGVRRIMGEHISKPSEMKPSPQQEEIWEAMQMGPKPRSISIVAYNKAISTELQDKVPEGVNASTMHSLGFAVVRKNASGRVKVNGDWKTLNLLEEEMDMDLREVRKERPTFVFAIKDLVSFCKQTMAGWTKENGLLPADDAEWADILDGICQHYMVELNGEREDVFAMVPKMLHKSMQTLREIDFDDMVWLPVVHQWPMFVYDLLIVDEAQDLNRSRQELALMAGKRIIFVGDPRQAIYGFAGADADSMPRMKEVLSETDQGCQHLYLTMTFRCGKSIVAEAQKIVPDFEAFDGNSLGEIMTDRMEQYDKTVTAGDMVLCRVNAPLISQCFRFLKEGRKATIQGRDIGKGLMRLIKKLNATDASDLMLKVDDWYQEECQKETKRKNPSENKLILLQDKHACLLAFCENCVTVEEILSRIEEIFRDVTGSKKEEFILFSSMHRSKGLESQNVYIIMPDGASVPHSMAKSEWQIAQEWNLKYVAITRAIGRLTWVS